jgi:hypothetical protein
MGKVNKAYPTLLGGVSQQAPENRRPGQHWEQTNFVSDPVRGLVRRPGTLYVGESAAPGDGVLGPNHAINQGWKAIDFRVAGKEYALFAPHQNNGVSYEENPAFCLNKTDNAIVPVEVRSIVEDAAENERLTDLFAGGISASVAVGRYLFLAGAGLTPSYTTTEQWDTPDNQSRFVVWVRNGGYSKKFRIALIRGNRKYWVEYTTLSASYPLPLDTSDLVTDDPDYIKKVNDRTNQYNAAVTQWIGRALEDALPTNVAEKLAYELQISGFLAPDAIVEVKGSTICITDDTIEEIEVDDGADNSSIRGVGNAVGAPELLSTIAYPGKVVQIRPNANTEGNVFYLRARAKDQSTGAFTAVTWEEAPGTLFTPTQALAWVTVEGGVCYIATRASILAAMSGLTVADYIPSECGDIDSSAPPDFLTNGITGLGLFQDRLIIESGPTFFSSRPGDYLNWFRASVLSVQANDPVSFVAIGGEDDTLRNNIIYDRNLVVFGDKKQYLIDGRKALEPRSASATIMSSYPDANDAAPLLLGNFLFYGKSVGDGIATLNQLAPGAIAESPESYEVSAVLEDYLTGRPWDMRASTSPDAVYFRTDTEKQTIFVYSFLDSANRQERQFEAWYKIKFDTRLGTLAGMSLHDGFLYMGFFRDTDSFDYRFVVDRLPLNTKTDLPYLDSMRPYTNGQPMSSPFFVTVADRAGSYYSEPLFGDYEGIEIEAFITPTSPMMTDRDGNPVLIGRLTVSNLELSLKDAGGIGVSVQQANDVYIWQRLLHGIDGDAVPVDLSDDRVGPACLVPEVPAEVVYSVGTLGGDMFQRSQDVATLTPQRAAFASIITENEFGASEAYDPVGPEGTSSDIFDVDGDILVTMDGTPEYTARTPADAPFSMKVKLTGSNFRAGPFFLTDNGKQAQALDHPFEYSYGDRWFDGDVSLPDGSPTRQGVLFRCLVGTNAPGRINIGVRGSAQQANGVGGVEVIPGYPSAFSSHETIAILLPSGYVQHPTDSRLDEYRLEFYYHPVTKTFEVWTLDEVGERVDQVYPALATGASVTAIQAILDGFLNGGEQGAGFLSGIVGTGVSFYTNGAAACPAPVEGPTDPVRTLVLETPEGGYFANGTISLADEHDDTLPYVLDAIPYENAKLVVPIGRESREYRLTISPYRWAPLTIANIEWTGQYFNNARRI